MAPVKKTKPKENSRAASVDPREVEKFTALAETWWDPHGPFKPLHQLNPTRLEFIQSELARHFNLKDNGDQPLKGLTVLDIGCGGGLLSEPMARLGATVTGIDAAEKNIHVAALHARKTGLAIDYRAISGEALAKRAKRFDIILNMEVLEHVADMTSFLGACRKLLKKSGCMLFSTINRTPKAYLFAILGAEYILNWLPRGTHTFEKFIKPSELDQLLTETGFELAELKGFEYSPLGARWKITRDCSVNYIGVALPQEK